MLIQLDVGLLWQRRQRPAPQLTFGRRRGDVAEELRGRAWCFQPENMKVGWDDYSQYMHMYAYVCIYIYCLKTGKIELMFQTTNQF